MRPKAEGEQNRSCELLAQHCGTLTQREQQDVLRHSLPKVLPQYLLMCVCNWDLYILPQ